MFNQGGVQQAHHQWASRPDDERFLSLDAMQDHFDAIRVRSHEVTVAARRLTVEQCDGGRGLQITGPNGHAYAPTNWAFSQLAALVGAPSGYLQSLPAPIVCEALNHGLRHRAATDQDVGVLLTRARPDDSDMVPSLRAVTGPRYGRIWNADHVRAIRERFGDGRSGDWRVPGEFGREVEITRRNTTLYASDRDFFVFLADERNRIEIPNRRAGRFGTFARGFYAWNSETGAGSAGVGTFLFDFACSNRTIWGPAEYQEIRMRHTAGASARFVDEVVPAIKAYGESSVRSITDGIAAAQAAKLDNVADWLAGRYSKREAEAMMTRHYQEEQRPIETLWDVSVAMTARARDITHQDSRVKMEREAGRVLDLAA